MNSRFILTALILNLYIMPATAFQITGYLPSYRLENADRAMGSSVLDLSGYSTDYSATRSVSLNNLEFSYRDFPPSYRLDNIEGWYGSHVDRIIYFSVKPGNEGALDKSALDDRDLARLSNISHLYGTELILAVSGSSELFAPVVADPDSREKMIGELANFCIENGFSGVDYDWEFPKTDEQLEHFFLLLKETKEHFSSKDLQVSAAVSRFRPLNQEIYDSLDSINLMAYDNYGRHSTYESAVEAAEYLQIRYDIEPSKINLGIPFYGRIYSGLDPQYWTSTMIYRDIRDDYTLSADQDEAGGFYFNGIETVRKKTAYAREEGLGGIMIWELGQDSFDEYSLLHAIRKEIQ